MRAVKISLVVAAISIPLLFAGASRACPVCLPRDEGATGQDRITARDPSANNMLLAAAGGLLIAGSGFAAMRILNGKQGRRS